MNLFKKSLIILSVGLVTACGGGGDSTPTSSSVANVQQPVISVPTTLDLKAYNDAWDKALVYKPYSSIPIKLKDLGYYSPAPVAISLHGCDGVQEPNRYLGDKYYPIFLSMQGYLVIEPDSYYGMKVGEPNSMLCYPGAMFNYNEKVTDRARDAEYAINKVKESAFWDGKTLLVQGQSQGFHLVNWLRPEYTKGVTKWLFSGHPFNSFPFEFTHNQPTMVINSETNLDLSTSLLDKTLNKYTNIIFKLIPGDFHVPIMSPIGYDIAKEWVKLN